MTQKIITSILLCATAILLFSTAYAKNFDDSSIISISQGEGQINFTIQDLEAQLHLSNIEVNDPVYQKQKHYTGFWLADILELANVHPSSSNLLTFIALDGYKASISQADIDKSKAKAFVAIKDLDAKDNWESIEQGKQTISPGPFYLVWKSTSSKVKLPWPYKIVKIVIGENNLDQKLFPDVNQQDPSVVNGSKIFRQNCMACHSINFEGGVLGPELNVPRNIMEYENRTFLQEFIANPNAFRARSKMPNFDKILSKQDINDVLNYLTWMGQHKIETHA